MTEKLKIVLPWVKETIDDKKIIGAKSLKYVYTWIDVLEYTISRLPIESNRLDQEYYLTPNTKREYITKFEILLVEVFLNSTE